MSDGAPSKIGKYEIESEIGRGGFGRVYKAVDPTVGRHVAIKVLASLGSEELARFQAEASAAGRLTHRNILTIYEFGDQDGVPFIAMEYLEGEDLDRAIEEHRLTLLQKADILAQVARGLGYAHQRGVVHRDIKPSNIRLLADGDIKVMDFGIARVARENTRLTATGNLIGTVRYMSPEQLQGHDADPATDIFSFGLVAYELLSGKHPFQADDPRSLMYRIVSTEPEPLSAVVPGIPTAFEHVVSRALEKDRDRRYQDFEELLLDLDPVLLDLRRQRGAELVSEAGSLLDAGQNDEAGKAIRDALGLDPYNPDARALRDRWSQARGSGAARIGAVLASARQYAAMAQFAEALHLVEVASRQYPNEPEVKALQAQLESELQASARAAQTKRLRPTDARDRAGPGPPPPASPQTETTPAPPPAAAAEETRILSKADLQHATEAERDEAAPAAGPTEFTQLFSLPPAAERLTAYLTVVSCPDSFREGQTVELSDRPFVIGRAPDCDLVIGEDSSLSRRHAEISRQGPGFVIRDFGSHNGTYINGRRIANQEPLLLNAEIRLSATTRLRFRCDISELPEFTGQVLDGRYTLGRCLRSSRKSALYEATDARPSRKVAVKLLSPTLASYPGYLEEFEREAQMAAALDHPHICKIYDYGRAPLQFGPQSSKTVHFLCMQMLEGGSLASRLDNPDYGTPVSVEQWLRVVCDALAHAHRHDVVHAGLKPTAIVFSGDGLPYVTDFAIATHARDGRGAAPVAGAPDYLAPEQWEGREAQPATDQYSLACLCYRLLTGSVPFENQSDPDTRRRNFERGLVPAHERASRCGRADVPPALSTVLSRALSVEPGDRFPSLPDFVSAFAAARAARPAEPSRRPKLFVSYRRDADAGWAAFFADKLTDNHGFEVFVDRHRIDSATRVPEKIESAIRDCDYFVCLLNRSTLQSAWVREEIRMAHEARKPMIPVIHEGFTRPKLRGFPQWLKRWLPLSVARWPECAADLLDGEEVRLFADYDHSAIDKLARIISGRGRRV